MTPEAPRAAELIRASDLLILDFDGTLVDSNAIKLGAFDVCFADLAPRHPEILKYCHANHHTPRGVKFRHVYENILKQPYTADIEADLHRRYAAATTPAVIGAPEIPGAERFLKILSAHRPIALISSTPHAVLLEILAGRGWRSYFKWIQGAPARKAEWITALAKDLKIRLNRCVFMGDTLEDAESAKSAGCPFIAVANTALAAVAAASIPDFTGINPALVKADAVDR